MLFRVLIFCNINQTYDIQDHAFPWKWSSLQIGLRSKKGSTLVARLMPPYKTGENGIE